MNVVMIGPFAFKPKGTVSVRAFFIARALVVCGHRVTVLMPPYDNLDDSGLAFEKDGVRLENMRIRRNDAWHQLVVPVQMARRAVRLEPHVVHVFKPVGYSGLAGIYLSRFSRCPLVLDTDDWEGTGGWNDINTYPWFWRRLFDWQEQWLTGHAGAVTVASRTLQSRACGLGVDPDQVIYLPNGPDMRLRQEPPVTAGQLQAIRARLGVYDAPFALYLGHIPNGTDLDLALDALALSGDRLPDARLVIAGVGDGLPQLRAHAQAVGVAQRTLFPGWIEPDEAHLFIAAADAIVNPYRDTLVNRSKCSGKVVSAMAVGKAVVTSRLGENVEYIVDGHSGLLTEPGSAKDIARALVSVLSNPALAAELGRNARRRIWEEFDWDSRVGEVERAYHLASEKRARPS